MKRTVSVIYTILVVAALLGTIAFFGWKTYQSRQLRISDFVARTDDYTRRLSDSVADRDVEKEVELAEKLMEDDLSLVAVQVFSREDGLRISVVKPIAGDFSRRPIAESEAFDGFIEKIRFHKVFIPLDADDMPGLEAAYVAAVLTDGEIRNNLLIILVTVSALFVITLLLILLKPGAGREPAAVGADREENALEDDFDSGAEDEGDFGFDAPSDDDFTVPEDFDAADSFDENDLLSSGPEFGDSMPMDDDFELPDLDDFPSAEASPGAGKFLERLESELERAASFNQDLTLFLFNPGQEHRQAVVGAFDYPDLIFEMEGGNIAVIEINKDLDSSLASAEDIFRGHFDRGGGRTMRAGIASRNGRLIGAQRLMTEAESALRKTDAEKNIVAFRSDPEKYREYLKSRED